MPKICTKRSVSLKNFFARVRQFSVRIKNLVLMFPRTVGNEPAPHHPFRDRIQSLIAANLSAFDLDRHLADPNAAPALQLVEPKLHALPHLKLPGIRRRWILSGGQYIDSRDRESLSSAAKFIFNPTAWVLRYKAKLWNDVSSEMITSVGVANEAIKAAHIYRKAVLDTYVPRNFMALSCPAIGQLTAGTFYDLQYELIVHKDAKAADCARSHSGSYR
jgi:hypothetical protein